jgi:single-strand DNA-binding protein
MAIGNQITIVGNLTDDVELRYTPNGTAVASFTVAVNRRFRDPASGEWKDGDTSFIKCNVWRQQAENVAETLGKGARAIVNGRLRTRSWETQEGQRRSVTEIEADTVGPSLEFATAEVKKRDRNDGSVPAWAGNSGSASAAGSGGGANGSDSPPIDEEPPF